MSPLCVVAEKALLGYELGDTAPTIPGSHYLGLLVASQWTASTAYTSGQYVISSAFNTLQATPSSISRIYKCTTAGTSGATEPAGFTAGSVAAGGTVTDGTVTWTEVSGLFGAGTFTGAEPSAGGYARVSITNNTTNWPAPTQSGAAASQVQNGTAVTFPTTTGSWGAFIVGLALFDALTAGNGRIWGCLAAKSAVASVAGVTPQFAANQLTATLY